MGKMKELVTTYDIVMDVLEQSPKARSSDNYLFYAVYAVIGRRNGINIDEIPVTRFFLNLKEYGFPSPETIRRARQKIQAEHPELCGCSEVEGQRLLNEEVFKDFARGF